MSTSQGLLLVIAGALAIYLFCSDDDDAGYSG